MGDRDAVQHLVRALQGDVYRLALRMLWNRQDAEDATQEILVRVITRLSRFDFGSRLATWVYRVATNYLLDVKKSAVERQRLTSGQFADDLSTSPESFEEARTLIRQVSNARRALEIHLATHPADSPVDFARRVVSALEPDGD